MEAIELTMISALAEASRPSAHILRDFRKAQDLNTRALVATPTDQPEICGLIAAAPRPRQAVIYL